MTAARDVAAAASLVSIEKRLLAATAAPALAVNGTPLTSTVVPATAVARVMVPVA
jgi:hypothetical protein